MGVLANHVPSIEQLKPGLIEIIEESGGSKQFFCKSKSIRMTPSSNDVVTGASPTSRPSTRLRSCSIRRIRYGATRLLTQH